MRKDRLILAGEFVGSQNTVELTISPVNGIFKNGQGMRMEQVVTSRQDLTSSSAVIITVIDVIHLGVSKVNPFGGQIKSQTVGPEDFAR
jgi:hypothetical protein